MNIIKSKPTAALFLSVLLSACTLHGNKQRGQEEEERIAKEIRPKRRLKQSGRERKRSSCTSEKQDGAVHGFSGVEEYSQLTPPS